ncbi:3-oxo-tetronate kinase [Cryobacterium tepidiphilum]|uniref:3-oxo-tetronate kinase n=1 Tax=Cryobacterium tepidiphilum TaxID=2486026 RepID=A0A3M8LNT0_9MICO|nr:3-oxo-tetronate kinase [Cryobacterium tepidiphilum]RNE67021.1 four-carbon acid sugar kinase family protein [Cryobacterium tepidiphilum]
MIAAIADDVTGATDVAVAFRRAGLAVRLVFGVPDDEVPASDPGATAIVIALKTRTCPRSEAVDQSLRAARWARGRGWDRLYVKYCSTFDSSAQGNIGPVADALADLVDARLTVVTPASPVHDRTVFEGLLFAGGTLLADSPMRHHPLTPMTDSSVPRLLAAQTARTIGHVRHRVVRTGREGLADALAALRSGGVRYAVVDAVDDADLLELGFACRDDRLVTGAAGLAAGLAGALREPGAAPGSTDALPSGPAAVLAGSCSARTLEQVAVMSRAHPSFRLDARRTPVPDRLAAEALAWFDSLDAGRAPLIYSSLPPAELAVVQHALGVQGAAELLESAFRVIATGLVERGVERLVVAGGETSGAVTEALGLRSGRVGAEAAAGVPWIHVDGAHPLAVLLKSGNFGPVDLLVEASSA